MLKVGAIGLGKMGKLHLMNMLHMKDLHVVAAADKRRKNLRTAEENGVHAYQDFRKLLRVEDLDVVVISLPNSLKEEGIVHAAEENLDIFVDKPLARNLAEATRIVAKVRKQGVRLMTGVNYRYIESVQRMRETMDEGKIGDIVIATSDLIMNGPFSHPLVPTPVSEWWLDREKAGGGALIDLGYHLIDIFHWMFGDLQIEYSSLGHRFNLPVEDSATVVLKSKNTATECMVNVGWFSKIVFPEFNFRINLHGTVGYSSTDKFAPRNLRVHAIKEASRNFFRKILGRKLNYLSYTYYYSSFYRILELFFETLREDLETPVSLEEQLEVIRIVENIYTQHEGLSDG